MKEKTLELFVCPEDGAPNLQLHVFSTIKKPWVVEVEEGVLVCPECNRWYPIINGILLILPDSERLVELDEYFFGLHKSFFEKNNGSLNFEKVSEKSDVKQVQKFWDKHVCMGVWENEKDQIQETDTVLTYGEKFA